MESVDARKIGNKIRDKRLENKQSQTTLAELLGTHQSMISSLENGERLPDIEFVVRFAGLFGVGIDWIVTDGMEPTPLVSDPQEDYTVTLPVKAMAGAGNPCCMDQLEPIGHITIDKSYNGPNIQVLQIRGNSMEPTIMDGSHVGIDITEKEIISGQMYAVFIPHEGVVVKRIWIGPELIKISSDNPSAPDHDMMAERINWDTFIQGRVKWTVQKYL